MCPRSLMAHVLVGEPASTSPEHALAVAEGVAVAVERGRAAEMGVEGFRARGEIAFGDEVDQALHRSSLVDRIGDHALEPGGEADRFLGLSRGYAVDRIGIVLDQ